MEFIISILVAGSLMIGSHELFHDTEAANLGVPMGWVKKNGDAALPLWVANTQDKDKLSRIAGAGFRGQDALAKAFDSVDLGQKYRLMSAINKFGYVAFPAGIGSSKSGDVNTMNKTIGVSGLQAGLVASALGDMYKAYNPKSPLEVNFWQAQSGTPGVEIKYKW